MTNQNKIGIDMEVDLLEFEKQLTKSVKVARDTGKKLDQELLSKLEIDVAELETTKRKIADMAKKNRALFKDGLIDRKQLQDTEVRLKRISSSTTEANRKLQNYKNTGEVSLSRLQAKFNQVTDEVKGTKEEILKLAKTDKQTKKLKDAIDKLEQELKSGKISAQKFKTELTKMGDAGKKAGGKLGKLGKIAGGAFAAMGGKRLLQGAANLSSYAARTQETQEAFTRMTDQREIDGKRLLKSLNTTSKGAISNDSLMLASNKAFSLGVADSTEDLDTLLEISRVKAKNMGITTEKAFDDIVTGLGRGSPMILDNLGITVKLGEAQEEYGKIIGKTVKEMTDQEKKQALVNYVVSRGKKELEETGDLAVTNAEKQARYGVALENLKITIGQLLLPVMMKLQEAFIYIATRVQEFTDKYPNLSKVLAAAAIALGVLATVAGSVLAAVTLLGPGFAVIGGTLGAMVAPVLAVVGVLAALGLAYKTNLGGFADTVNKLGAQIKVVLDFLKGKFIEFGKFLNEKFGDEFKLIMDGVKEYFIGMMNIINIGLAWLSKIFNKSGEDIGIFGKIVASVFDYVAIIFKSLMDVLEFGLSTLGNVFKVFGKVMQGDFQGAFDTVLQIGANFGELLKNLFKNIFNGGLNIIGNFSEDFANYGRNLMTALGRGIQEKFEMLKQKVKDVAGMIKNFLGINSPTKEGPLSVDQSKWGRNLIKAISQGIQDEERTLNKRVQKIADKLSSLGLIDIDTGEITDKARSKYNIPKETSAVETPESYDLASIGNAADFTEGKDLAQNYYDTLIDNAEKYRETIEDIKQVQSEIEADLASLETSKDSQLAERKLEIEKQLEANDNIRERIELEKELKQLEGIVDTDVYEEIKRVEQLSETEKILESYNAEKEALEAKLALTQEKLEAEQELFDGVQKAKIAAEKVFTGLIVTETDKRIAEQNRMLESAKAIARQMAALGFSGSGFKATFSKQVSDGNGGSRTITETKVVNYNTINQENTIKDSVDVHKVGKSIIKQMESSAKGISTKT